MDSTDFFAPGAVIAARYTVIRTLGRGGMGVVYKAQDRLLNETVAIKVLRVDLHADDAARRFVSEIKLARTVSHRNVCRIHEYGEDGGLRYISMAFVDGVDLRYILQTKGALPVEQVVDVAAQVCDGLQAIHEEGIVHRDLKPGNVMIDVRGIARLMDFGIAKQTDGTASDATATGLIVGTPNYMSPEQIRGEKLDARADVYALGVMAFEMFTGRLPFRAETPAGLIFQHMQEPPPLDGPEAAGLPLSVRALLARALAKERDARFGSAAEFGQVLRQACEAETGTPQTVPIVTASGGTAEAPRRAAASATTAPVARRPLSTAGALRPLPREAVMPTVSGSRRRVSPLAIVVGGVFGLGALIVVAGVAFFVLRDRPRPAAPQVARTPFADRSVTVATPAPLPLGAPSAPRAGATATPSASQVPASASPASAVAVVPAERRTLAPPRMAEARNPEIEGLVSEAESAFGAQDYETALTFYEQALRLAPNDTRARVGRDLCAKALAGGAVQPSRGRTLGARSFTMGQTTLLGTGAQPAGPAGFSTGGNVTARALTQARPLPGKIVFEMDPPAVRPGDSFTLRIVLVNERPSPLILAEMRVLQAVNGRNAGGPVTMQTAQVAPRQRGLLLTLSDQWKADTASWSLAVHLRTADGDVLQNTLTWQ